MSGTVNGLDLMRSLTRAIAKLQHHLQVSKRITKIHNKSYGVNDIATPGKHIEEFDFPVALVELQGIVVRQPIR